MGQDLVELFVGENETKFVVHKELLCAHSDYFQRAFKGKFQESEDGFIRVTEVSEATFRIFQQWLYGQLIRDAISVRKTPYEIATMGLDEDENGHNGIETENDAANAMDDDDDDDDDNSSEEEVEGEGEDEDEDEEMQDDEEDAENEVAIYYYQLMESIVELYVLADRYETRQLRNDVITALRGYNKETDCYPDLHTVLKAYEKLPESSTLCQYIIKTNALHWNPAKDSEKERREIYPLLPYDFTLNVMLINNRRANSSKKKWSEELENELADHCNFHEHKDDKEKKTCKQQRKWDKVFIRNLLVSCMPAIKETSSSSQG
jgi:hypothetical protein